MSTVSEHTHHPESPLSMTQEAIRQSDNLNRQITKALNQLPAQDALNMMYQIANWENVVHEPKEASEEIRQTKRDAWKKDVYFLTLLNVIRINFPKLGPKIDTAITNYYNAPDFVRYTTGQSVYAELFLGKPAIYLYKAIREIDQPPIHFYQDLSRVCAFYHLHQLELDANTPHPTLAASGLIRVVGEESIADYEKVISQLS